MAIELKDALNLLVSGDWVSLRYHTANLKQGTGGKVIELPKCRIARRQPGATASAAGKPADSHTKKRNANHAANATRNVELPNGSILTVHIILISMINGQSLLHSSQEVPPA